MAKKCNEYIGNLNDYLDGDLSAELCEEIEKHLGECENCRIMVDTLKQTVSLCREGQQENLPTSLDNTLKELLKKKWQKKFGK